MARINKTRFALLGFLTIEPMSAYEIKKMIVKSTAYFWTESDGQLYPMLTKLAQEGCVTCKKQSSQNGGVKKIYSITKKGLNQLHNWLENINTNNTYRSEFLLKIFFSGNVDKTTLAALLEREKNELLVVLEQLKSFSEKMKQHDMNDFHHYCRYLTIDYGITMINSEIAWMDKTISQLNQ